MELVAQGRAKHAAGQRSSLKVHEVVSGFTEINATESSLKGGALFEMLKF